jgi:ribosomal protein S18 acetylase RimI-like enzyme
MDPVLRPLTLDDVPAWAELLAGVEATDRTGEHHSPADLEEQLTAPETQPEDRVGAFDGDRLVGYFTVLPRGETEGVFAVHGAGGVLPARRGEGIGSRLVTGMVRRASAVAAARRPELPARLSTFTVATNRAAADLLGRAGMCPVRTDHVMRTALTDLAAAPELPDGYAARPYDDSLADAVRVAHNEAFGGQHRGFVPWSEETWHHQVTASSSFRPGLSRVVTTKDGRIAGYLITHDYAGDQAATHRRDAHIARVGTLVEHRGRGIATALLLHCLHAYAEAGYDEASLGVDTENPSGAGRIYQRVGFTVDKEWTTFAMTTS